MRASAVYIIRLNGLYKIGRSTDPRKRIDGMQLPGKPEVIAVGWTADSKNLEYLLHERFSDKRRHGEWFALTHDELDEAVNRIHLRQTAELTIQA